MLRESVWVRGSGESGQAWGSALGFLRFTFDYIKISMKGLGNSYEQNCLSILSLDINNSSKNIT